uniref:ER membrane protein complex subunit 4 n=1 Tax=Rhabditophanes sp. KR3021 TaxID=114890 RepID=A0AC35TP42_9BILA
MTTKKETVNPLAKWKLDLAACKSQTKLPNPPGFNPKNIGANYGEPIAEDKEQQNKILEKRSMDMAIAPFKSIPMNLFMMYMSGNTVSIFPIMMVGSMFWRPIGAIVTVGSTFKGLEEQLSRSLILHKIIFVLGNLGALFLAMYKCHSMGLLPNGTSDWLDMLDHPIPVQESTWSGSLFSY